MWQSVENHRWIKKLMKKLILILQILIFTSQSVRADDSKGFVNEPPTVEAAQAIATQMPSNFRRPLARILDVASSVKVYNEFITASGKMENVSAISGQFASTAGEEQKAEVHKLLSQSKEQAIILYTLDATMERAKIYKKIMALEGVELIIMKVPEEYEKEFLEKAAAKAAGRLTEFWWHTKNTAGKLIHPIKTVSDIVTITKDQFFRPTMDDLRLTAVTTSIDAGLTLSLSIGVDWRFAIAMTAARAFFTGTTTLFNKTINNVFRADIANPFGVTSTSRQAAARLLTLSLPIGQTYFAIGTNWFSDNYTLTQGQLYLNTLTTGIIGTISTVERNNRLSETASRNMYFNTFIIGSIIGAMGTLGHVGPMVLDFGTMQVGTHAFSGGISTLQMASVAIYSSLYYSYKYFTKRVEKIAQKTLRDYFIERYTRFMNFQDLRKKRLEKELQQKLESQERLSWARNEIRQSRNQRFNIFSPSGAVCSRLFQ
jgi:hypothetical protein